MIQGKRRKLQEPEAKAKQPIPDLSVILVNYNGKDLLPNCLGSLFDVGAALQIECIVVDNGSQDNSVELLGQMFPQARLVVNRENRGFAAANNQGMALARSEYLLLLNTDTVFHQGLERMLQLLQDGDNIGAVGPVMMDANNHPRDSWGYFPTLSRLLITMLLLDRLPWVSQRAHPFIVRPHHAEFQNEIAISHTVDWISGACFLTTRQVVDHIGPFDTNLFMYNEDVEWCYRMRQAGYAVWVTPDATITHLGAGGTERNHWKGSSATQNAYRGFLYFHHKYSSPRRQFLLRLALSIGALLRLGAGVALYLTNYGGSRQRARQVCQAYANVLKLMVTPPTW